MGFTVKVKRVQHVKLPAKVPGPRQIKVGFPAGEADSDVIERAVFNNFGTRRGIPERPFMQNAMRENENRYRSALKTSAAKILRGEVNTRGVLSKLGILAQGDIQEEITSLASPPNSPITIALKGSSNPLIDSGEMRGAVTWKVHK